MTHPTLTQSHGSAYTRLYSVGAARGENAVPNGDLVGPIDSSDEWIQQRTGIVTRVRAGADVLAVDLATDAGREAIERSGIPADQIDLVIVATVSNVQQTPSIAAIVADRVGSNPAAAYDTNAACAGYAYAVAQADALIRAGAAHYALVIGAEKLSDVVDPTDRTISFLLGDGAGAVVVGPADEPGIGATVWGSDGSKAGAVGMNHTLIDFREGRSEWPTLRQEGQTVFRWAVWDMARVAKQALDAAGITAGDLAAFIPHQANMRIIDEFAKQLRLPESVVIARDIVTTGNTSAASIPLALDVACRDGRVKQGDLVMIEAIGGGFTWGSALLRW
jgi:3-oxoacyl-[acyl-carrier-protein] synthase-3